MFEDTAHLHLNRDPKICPSLSSECNLVPCLLLGSKAALLALAFQLAIYLGWKALHEYSNPNNCKSLKIMSKDPPKSFFVLRHTYFSDEGPIQLGSIITNPLKADESINKGAILTIAEADKNNPNFEYEQTYTLKSPKNTTVGIFAKFLQVTGLDLSYTRNAVREDSWTFEKLERRMFTPSKTYVEQALKQQAITDAVSAKATSPNLYIVTGLCIGHGDTTHRWIRSTKHNPNATVGIDVPAAGASVGPRFSHDTEDSAEGEGKVKEVFVFAYRMKEIRYKKDMVYLKDYDKGELHNKNEVVDEVDKGKLTGLQLRGIRPKDVGAKDLSMEGELGYDDIGEEGEECELIVVPE